MAKWDEREDDEEAEDEHEGVVWLGGFVGFADLILAQYVSISDNVWRCSEFANKNTRVKLDSEEISANSDLTWNQTFSLDCLGNDQNSIKWLKQETLIFELRSRSTAPFIGRISGSKLIGRAEIPWKNVIEAEEMETEKWIFMIPQNGRVHDDVKPPAVQIDNELLAIGAALEAM
ncbi:hypothetical protein BUALT_Bualt04G0021400 [Buddleja alternifolia]|uniref:C2 domain-containing protein n=1 Tax=Buddleja alternifolia TaxID=168488 RepID=A0AAV6XLZ2_9LAMI|nr:hypothetical protein BUALT_Bualt04G0021400 [Buddleja alternifolia]